MNFRHGIFLIMIISLALTGCGKKEEAAPSAQISVATPATESVPEVAAQTGAKGVIAGRVLYTGTAPVPQTLALDADPGCQTFRGGQPLLSEELLVGSGQGLQNAFVYLKTGLEGRSFNAPAAAARLDQKGCQYVPHVMGMQVNQPLEIVNSDATLHNVHGMPQTQKDFNLGMPVQNMKLTRQFAQPDVMVKFKCDVHPWMNAYVGVVPHPFFAVTGADGAFQIPEVPAGTYTLEIWHEKLGTQTKEVVVSEVSPAAVEAVFA